MNTLDSIFFLCHQSISSQINFQVSAPWWAKWKALLHQRGFAIGLGEQLDPTTKI